MDGPIPEILASLPAHAAGLARRLRDPGGAIAQRRVKTVMNSERWRQLKDLFGQALECTGDERAALLERGCAGDPELRAEVESLLTAHEGAGAFLDGGASPRTAIEVDDAPLAGSHDLRRIGAYQLVREIGQGGMGTVYQAVRVDEEYRKDVAIKLIRRGMDSDLVVSRFRNERQILAALVHPNIAALLDGGTTEDGLPYIVMEYVDGERIDRYCDEHRLSTSARLELFLAVCSAVQHAHARLVVHRDLKPGNILVTRAGVPKLLDFGVAKLLDPDDVAEQTAAQLRFVTPAFASPEQIRGAPITTASDVYSLGALLYLLLTGRWAYGSPSDGNAEIARAVCDEEPAKPSTVVYDGPRGAVDVALTAKAVSAVREGTPGKLARRLAGDLDTIVLKALRKEPEQRYGSVEQLSTDIRRHLQGLPVSAVPSRLGYRALKFVSRHRSGVAAAMLVALSMGGGLFETSRQRARAERRLLDVRKLANSFLFEFHDAIRDLPGSMKARELVVKRAQEYLARLAEAAPGDLDLERELADSYLKLGELQGGRGSNMGDLHGAVASFRSELALREAVLAAARDDPESSRYLARALDDLGLARLQLRDSSGLDDLRRALGIREGLLARQPRALAALRDLARSHEAIALVYADRGEHLQAREQRELQVELSERIAAADPDGRYVQRNLALGYRWLAEELVATGEPVRARQLARKSVAVDRARVEASSADALVKLDLSYDHSTLGRALALTGDLTGAIESYGQAVALAQELVAADSANATAGEALVWAYRGIGAALRDAGQQARARDSFLEAARALEELLRKGQAPTWLRYLARTYSDLGVAEVSLAQDSTTPLSQRMNHWREARAWYDKSQGAYGALRAPSKDSVDETSDSADNRRQIALCEAALANDVARAGPPPAPPEAQSQSPVPTPQQ